MSRQHMHTLDFILDPPGDLPFPPLHSRERAGVRVVALDRGREYASRAGTRPPYTLDIDAADGGKNAN